MIIVLHSKGEDYNLIIDDEDFHKISKYNWCIIHPKHTKYCATHININGKKKNLYLHRFLMNLEQDDKRVINHIDGNGLNNSISNLQICDAMYNAQSINKKTRFGHICYRENKGKKKYQATVTINKKGYCKCFLTYGEAEAWLDGLKQIAIAETVPFQ